MMEAMELDTKLPLGQSLFSIQDNNLLIIQQVCKCAAYRQNKNNLCKIDRNQQQHFDGKIQIIFFLIFVR